MVESTISIPDELKTMAHVDEIPGMRRPKEASSMNLRESEA
jgi:hypothetical protein